MKKLMSLMIREHKGNNLLKMTKLFFLYVLSNLTRIAVLCKENLAKRRGKRASQMSRVFPLCSLMLFVGLSVFAQVDRTLIEKAKAREASDPEATKILDAVNKKYDLMESMKLEFKLTIKGENESKQEGKMTLKGDQYRLEIADQDVICNGKTVWFHLKDNEEVQINNPDPDGEDFLSPTKMLSIYRENMVGQMLDDIKLNGRIVHQIEIKPRESHDEITKLRVTIDKEKKELVKVIVFTRYADRYIFEFENLVENPKLSDTLFNFDVAKFPGIHVEDLRIE